jgi:type VI protein secretion system component Hcp
MANDVFAKFGKSPTPDYGGPLKTEIPDIEGDSTDSRHYWWCELRECGFDMETPQQEDEDNQSDANTPATAFKPVTLRKRVDWASTQLFLKCCAAAMATTTKSTDDQNDGRINQVVVEVCRPADGEKIPCVTITYYGVRITRYAIAINEPEPAETVTFEFDRVKFKYLRTDPSTGRVMHSSGLETPEMDNHHNEVAASGAGAGAPAASAASNSASSAGAAAAVSAATPAAPGVGSPNGANPNQGSSPDATVNVNFPGLWQGNGFGLLPD